MINSTLLGGERFDLDHPECYLGYSDKVYEFNLDTLTTQIKEPVVLHPDRVLIPLNNLLNPKFPLVANLRDRFYALHFKIPIPLIPFHKPKDQRFTFEQFDPITKSWLPAPDPLFYQSNKKADVTTEPPEMAWPGKFFPLSSHFVVDDKFLVFSDTQLMVHIFNNKEWKAYSDKYTSICESFHQICSQSVPDTGLWLSNFGYDNLGVMLSIRLLERHEHNCNDIEVPPEYLYTGLGYVFYHTFRLYAYAINKSTCHVEFYQPLDEIFSDMIRTPLNTEKGVTNYLLDLGESEHNNNRSRRICAILTGDDLMNRIPYLYISIFELQMTQATSLHPCSKFLHVITPIKKLMFRLDKDKHRLANAYNNNSFVFSAYDFPPLDAFVV